MLSTNAAFYYDFWKLNYALICCELNISRTHNNGSSCIFLSFYWGVVHFLLKTLSWTVLLQSTRPWSSLMIRGWRCLNGPVVPPTCSPNPSASLLISQEPNIVSAGLAYYSTLWTGNGSEWIWFRHAEIIWYTLFDENQFLEDLVCKE